MTRKYTKDHEWVQIENDIATIGITEHAAEALGELVYVELPEVGDQLNKGDAAVVVESSKSASDVYSAVSGEVTAVNTSLSDTPENVNNSTYQDGWLIKVKVSNPSDIDDCLDETAYKAHLQENS